MTPSLKAALVNGLLFPGLGHLLLRRAGRGCLFLLPTLLAAVYLLRRMMQLILPLAEQIASGALPFDPELITQRVEAAGIAGPAGTLAVLVLLGCWLGSVGDALWLGRHSGH
ncbi:DUF6677 family protein [Rugamonas sp. CCM 8940]|uniref:DUF6677 family protein n=1 Tax=Rugamonas sp. CCM 8940 TaxID=2765359 RepID=UPI0018F3EF5A|nr:DUF6677 family protein [Rugamonas sp. CCM 8940]MBJ7310637.1 hypothetical protein [Rugamonas sp. CCM 8940]